MRFRLASTVSVACLFGILVTATCNNCRAQMFGERSVGGQGMLSGNERFLRGNRSRRDFVGSNRSDQTGFVGAQQALATGRVPSATEGLRIDRTNPNRVNRPMAPQPTRGMYYPKLDVDLSLSNAESQTIRARSEEIEVRLQERLQRIGGPETQFTIDRSVAILRGRVDSRATAELLEQLVRFEPGIEAVQNELQFDNGQESGGR